MTLIRWGATNSKVTVKMADEHHKQLTGEKTSKQKKKNFFWQSQAERKQLTQQFSSVTIEVRLGFNISWKPLTDQQRKRKENTEGHTYSTWDCLRKNDRHMAWASFEFAFCIKQKSSIDYKCIESLRTATHPLLGTAYLRNACADH